jgi:hypothetical protein
METLFALSIRQPWLDMILKGIKTVEVRTWEPKPPSPTIALHASQRVEFDAAYFYGYSNPWMLQRGRIVALADIIEVRLYDAESWISDLEAHRQPLPFRGGSYGIQLGNIRILKQAIRHSGSLMLFPLPSDVASRILSLDQ